MQEMSCIASFPWEEYEERKCRLSLNDLNKTDLLIFKCDAEDGVFILVFFIYKGKKSQYTEPGKMKWNKKLSAVLWQSRWNKWQLIAMHSTNQLREVTLELEKVAYCVRIKIQHDGAVSLPDVRSFIY